MKKPSFISKIIEKLLWFTKWPTLKRKSHFDEHLEHLRAKEYKPYVLPRLKYKSDLDYEAFESLKIYKLSSQETSKRCVVYFHGGGFIHEIKLVHWLLIDRLCHKTGCDFIVPIYPLAPKHSFSHANESLLEYYDTLLESYSESQIVFMSDSAGSSLALSQNYQLIERGYQGPAKQILISPWVDLEMLHDENYKPYEGLDPLLGLYALRKTGLAWAGHLPVSDPLISPINGPIEVFNNVSIYTGTKDLLYPDIQRFYHKLIHEDCQVNYHEYQDMLHAFILFGFPESLDAEEKIIEELK